MELIIGLLGGLSNLICLSCLEHCLKYFSVIVTITHECTAVKVVVQQLNEVMLSLQSLSTLLTQQRIGMCKGPAWSVCLLIS